MLGILTQELLDGEPAETNSALDLAIRLRVMEAKTTYDRDPSEFQHMLRNSISEWDHYLQSALYETPDALAIQLCSALQEHRLRVL
jgi:hypothetical protein